MASTAKSSTSGDISLCLWEYNRQIMKIPELQKMSAHDYYRLPCVEYYSIVTVYSDLFVILGFLFDEENLRYNVLTHIRKHWRYYDKIVQPYLHLKKLNLAQWLVSMKSNINIPADEICIHTSGIYLNIHITVDYHLGI